ncbi:MAG: glycosyltransferase [Candidatus Omnitrophica bacterium]|nr:glycosyltransferase [Candidatus Omnitrophota bacterium]
MTKKPKVSVIMLVYNTAEFLREAVDSILNQTFKNFELIVINNGSTDDSGKILKSYADRRIRIIEIKNGVAIPRARNIGVRAASGEYVAIMDSDDVSMPARFAKQVFYLDNHPEIGILGGQHALIYTRGRPTMASRFPIETNLIRWYIMCGTASISDPTVMMRRAIVNKLSGYLETAIIASDYELWSRAILHTKIANCHEVLLHRRLWENNISFRDPVLERNVVIASMARLIKMVLGKNVSKKKVANLLYLERLLFLPRFRTVNSVNKKINSHCLKLMTGISPDTPVEIKSTARLLRRLYEVYMQRYFLSREEKRQITVHTLKKLFLLAERAKKFSMSAREVSSIMKL